MRDLRRLNMTVSSSELYATWQAHDEDAIQGVLGNLKYAGRRQELEQLRAQSQQAFIDSWRLEEGDPVYAVLIEAYGRSATRGRITGNER